MKKNKVLSIALIILIAVLVFSGCSAIQAKNQANDMLQNYFSMYNDGDIAKCVDMFNEKLIDDIGDRETTELVFNSRRYLLGEVEKSKVTGFDSSDNFVETLITLDVEVHYENAEEAVFEKYTFLVSDDEIEILGFDFSDQQYPVCTKLIDDYFAQLDSISYLKGMYIPYVADNLFDEASIAEQNEYALAAGGKYVGHSITDLTYYFSKADLGEGIYYLAQVDADLEFENEDFILYAEISSQNDEVMFNYLEYYPKKPYEIISDYYESITAKDSDAVIGMYNEAFFEYSDFLPVEWKTEGIEALMNNYGEFIHYEITGWEFYEVDIAGENTEVYSFNIVSYYDGGTFDEYISFLRGQESQAIVGHYISIR